MTIFTLLIGESADGRTLHPSEADPEEGFPFPDLESAQEEGERLAGRPVTWTRVHAGAWKAIVGDGRVAEIIEGTPARIVPSVGLLD
ncbi:hypothetical protein [Pseudarthrobacter siccitolerans]